VVDALAAAQERADLLDLVAQRGEHPYLDPEQRQPPRQPRAVRILDVARDDLVADGEDDRAAPAVHGPIVGRAGAVPQRSGNGRRASAAATWDVTQTGVVT